MNEKIDKAFRAVIGEFNPDIVHFHNLRDLSVNLIHIARNLKIPIVFTLHDYWLLCQRSFLLDSNLNICKEGCNFKSYLECYLNVRINKPLFINELAKKLGLCKKIEFLVDSVLIGLIVCYEALYFEFRVVKKVAVDVDLFIALSRSLLDRFIKAGFLRRNLIYFPLGIDMSIFKEHKNTCYTRLRFGFIASIITLSKGIKILLEAFNTIENAQLLIYGKAPLAYEQEEILKFLDNKNIEFNHEFNHDNIGEVLSGVDVLVIPSICVENSPLIIREAFAAKVPVIASRIGGIPELVRDGENGLLFKAGDVNELRSKIQYLIDNPQEIEKMRERIPPVKSIEEHAKEIEEIYARLIKYNKA
jgi:glycosyltransferase involved in cell wall biosynthesis